MRLAANALLLPALLWMLATSCARDAGAQPAAPVGSAAANPPVAAPARAVDADADCNLQTVLVPGVPGSPGHLIQSPRNPNGDSELSTLMRQFVDDLRDARTLAEAKQPQAKKLLPTHRKMRCAWPTKPEERNEKYDGHAVGYLSAVKLFDGEPTKANYNAMITGCVACHTVTCGGVLDFIDSLKWQ
jgi:hypothetical protein